MHFCTTAAFSQLGSLCSLLDEYQQIVLYSADKSHIFVAQSFFKITMTITLFIFEDKIDLFVYICQVVSCSFTLDFYHGLSSETKLVILKGPASVQYSANHSRLQLFLAIFLNCFKLDPCHSHTDSLDITVVLQRQQDNEVECDCVSYTCRP